MLEQYNYFLFLLLHLDIFPFVDKQGIITKFFK
jgi:hypothetical protein